MAYCDIDTAVGTALSDVRLPTLQPPTSEHVFVHFTSTVSRRCIFPGPSKCCQRCSIYPFSFSLQAFPSSCLLSISLFSKVVTTWIGVCAVLYANLTLLPIIRKGSPYFSPLSPSFSFCLTGTRYLFFCVLQRFRSCHEFVKHRRMVIFTKAMESKLTDLLHRSDILRRVLFGDWEGLLGCIGFGISMRNWAESLDKFNDRLRVESFYAQCIAALATYKSPTRKRLGHGRHGGWIHMVKNLPVTTPLRLTSVTSMTTTFYSLTPFSSFA